MSNLFTWQVHGDGKTLKPGEGVEPECGDAVVGIEVIAND